MKSSLVILLLLVFNTTAIFSESIALFIKNIDTWILILLETLLIVGYFINNMFKDINKTFEMELNNLNFYPKKYKK